jgi:hypothetical protein
MSLCLENRSLLPLLFSVFLFSGWLDEAGALMSFFFLILFLDMTILLYI